MTDETDPRSLKTLSDQTQALQKELDALERAARGFSKAMTSGLSDAIIKGRDLDDILRSVALTMSNRALTQALAPVENLAANTIGALASGLGQWVAGSLTGQPAESAGGLGAFLSATPQAPSAASIVNVSIAAQDVESFRRSEAEITASLARAVARGQRSL